MQFNSNRVWVAAISLWLIAAVVSAKEISPTWLLVDTEKLTLKVMRGNQTEIIFRNISIGRNGAGADKRRGDEKTPLGTFRIGWINQNSRYHLFFGLTYPSLKIAEEGFANGAIGLDAYIKIRAAIKAGRIPPQNSGLGGQIGIHGLGNADSSIHNKLNWTAGCVALTNEQVDLLSQWVFKGMRVVVI